MSKKILPILLSGGAGTRLWPLSRAAYPKQLLPLIGDTTLLQQTAARVADASLFLPPVVICNDEHRFMVAEQLRTAAHPPKSIVLEPEGRNSGPAVAIAALLAAQSDPQQLVLVLPSDHAVADQTAFIHAARQAALAAAEGFLVTFGIPARTPETGYGYILRGEGLSGAPGCFHVRKFVEKPDLIRAKEYVASGQYAWNSGMFLFRADTMIEEFETHQPTMIAAARSALHQAKLDLDFLRLDANEFAKAPALSIDYAIMEKTGRAAVIPAEIGWTDIGSWSALWDVSHHDENGNSMLGDVIVAGGGHNYIRAQDRLIAAVGVNDLVIVDTKDALLVMARARAQELRHVIERLNQAGRPEPKLHRQVFRPWGSYEPIDQGAGFQVKRLIVNPGAKLSLQKHAHRAEHWIVVRGTARVTRDRDVFDLYPNQSTYIPLGAVHRLENPGTEPLHLIEVQSGDYLGEDDIVRLEDHYGRVEKTGY